MNLVQLQNTVQWSELIVICVGIITLIGSITAIIINKIGKVSDDISLVNQNVAIVQEQNITDKANAVVIFQKIEKMEQARFRDVVEFTKVVGNLNTTLGKIETALDNQTQVTQELKDTLQKQNEEISKLKEKV